MKEGDKVIVSLGFKDDYEGEIVCKDLTSFLNWIVKDDKDIYTSLKPSSFKIIKE